MIFGTPFYDPPAPAPLKPGDSILPYGFIGIDLGGSWTYGLYQDRANRHMYVCYQNTVIAAYPEAQDRQARRLYWLYESGERAMREAYNADIPLACEIATHLLYVPAGYQPEEKLARLIAEHNRAVESQNT
jgi:hypothetical protein